MDVPQVRYANVGDGSIAYQTFGEGPPDLVVTPGFVSHLDLQWTMPSYFRLPFPIRRRAKPGGDELIIELREPRELTAADHMSLFWLGAPQWHSGLSPPWLREPGDGS